MLATVLSSITFIYLLTLLARQGPKLNRRVTRILKIVGFGLTPVLITFLILSNFNIYPRGYWFTRRLFWIVLLLMMIVFGLGDKSVQTKIERFFLGIFFYFPLAWIPILIVPFMGAGLGLIFYVALIGDRSFILYSDDRIRIEKQSIPFFGPDPPMDVYVKNKFFSSKEKTLLMGFDREKDSLAVRKLNDSTYSVVRFSPNNWQVPEGSEEMTFSIKSTKNKH